MSEEQGQAVEHMPAIKLTGEDLRLGFWQSLHKLLGAPGLAFTVKARLSAIARDLDKQAKVLQSEYDEKVKALPAVAEGEVNHALEALSKEFMAAEMLIPGRKIKAEMLNEAKDLTAHDLVRLTPILDGLE